jgi:hypothetical protein
MEDPKDFQLLDDDDDVTSSPLFDLNFNLNISNSSNNKNPNNKNGQEASSSTTFKSSSRNEPTNSLTRGGSLGSSDASRYKYNISPNRPPASGSSAASLDIKPIERPRSHSPLKMKGIEDYIKYHAQNRVATGGAKSQVNSNKITMNLKMDDLLANSGKNESYQVLSDFDFLNSDMSSDVGDLRGKSNRKRSLEQYNNAVGPNAFKQMENSNFMRKRSDEKENEGDEDEDENDDDNEDDEKSYIKDEDDAKHNLKYKYVASYRKDETTGSFQEKSRITFEGKSETADKENYSLPDRSTALVSTSQRAPPPPPPPLISSNYSSSTASSSIAAVQSQVQSALEALLNNSKKLENKLDKIDDMTISGASFYDFSSNIAPVSSEPQRQQQQETKEKNSDEQQKQSSFTSETPTIKKKNESFFNDILTKSDDLIAQTQSKLERLSKLDTVNKPLAPKPTAPVAQPKPKPVASPLPNSFAPQSAQSQIQTAANANVSDSSSAASSAAAATATTNNLNNRIPSPGALAVGDGSSSINNSKSLIDLKATTPLESNVQTPSEADSIAPISQIDLLFDINNDSFNLNTEPIRQGSSYFDLIGLNKTEDATTADANLTTGSQMKPSLPSELFNLFEVSNTGVVLSGSAHSTPRSQTPSGSSAPPTPFGEEQPYPIVSDLPVANAEVEQIEDLGQAKAELELKLEPEPIPPIDILITEPLNEKDDNNIVPEGLFNLKHEIPYDQSRPHSPSFVHNDQVAPVVSQAASPSFPISQTTTEPASVASALSELDLNFFIDKAATPPPAITSTTSVRPATTSPNTNVSPTSIVRSRPTTPATRSSRPPSPPIPVSAATVARSRPTSPLPRVSPETIPELEIIDDILNAEKNRISAEVKPETKRKVKSKPKERIRTYKISDGSSTGGEQASSSSSSDDEEQEMKFQIRIRPKPKMGSGSTYNSGNESDTSELRATPAAFVPLLPRPPSTQKEIEELRQRRMSGGSETGSTRRSLKDDESSDEEIAKSSIGKQQQPHVGENAQRKDSVQSEFNLELPDADDSLPLVDFHEKCELDNYPDGSYGCMLLVRQPFRNPTLMYKNALQKITEVRTWTECLVRLVDAGPSTKKLLFYNAHDLLSLATELDTTLEKLLNYKFTPNREAKLDTVSNTGEDDDEKSIPGKAKDSTPKRDESEILKRISPFHEIELKASYKFSELSLQQYDTYTKIHTFKLQEIIFKELFQMRPDRLMALPERFFKRFTKPKATSLLDHTPLPFEICKFAHMNYKYLRSFLLLLQDVFWQLPTITRKLQREQQLKDIQQQPASASMSISSAAASLFSLGANKPINNPTLSSVTSSHTREEITIKVVDEYKCKLNSECRIVEHKSRTRVFLITFLNAPDPIIEVGLNDCLRHGKEVVGRYDIIPIKTEQWISPEMFEINENILDKEEFEKTHCLRCVQMPDNLLVEIMRFRTRPRRNYELPLQVRCFMAIVERLVEIRIECTVAGTYYSKVNETHCEDIEIRFPLPDVWVYLFRVEKRFRYGAVHSSKSKFGKIKGLDRLLVHKQGGQGAMMEASCGMAKYEQAFKSLVWRIEQLPVKNKGKLFFYRLTSFCYFYFYFFFFYFLVLINLDIYKTHMLICKLHLQEYDKMPEKYEDIAYVQYSIPICAASKCQVIMRFY